MDRLPIRSSLLPDRSVRPAATLLLALVATACSRSVPDTIQVPTVRDETVFLLNLEPERLSVGGRDAIDLRRPGRGNVRIRLLAIGNHLRRVLQEARGSAVRFRSVLQPNARLSFEVGFGAPPYVDRPVEQADGPFTLEAVAVSPSGEESVLWSEELRQPAQGVSDAWRRVELDLPFDEGDLVLRTQGPGGDEVPPGAPGWADPRIVVPSAPIPRVERPARNVVVFLFDTLRGDHVGPLGYHAGTTPTLDALASESFVLTRTQAAASWTKASVGSLMTSLYPSVHGAEGYQDRMRDNDHTLAWELARAGFQTGAIGYNSWVFNPAFNVTQGFQSVLEVLDQDRDGGARADAVVAEAIDWIERREGQRFFAYVHVIDPHGPYIPAAEERARFVPPYDGPMTGLLKGPGSHKGKRRADLSEEDLRHIVALYDAEIAFADRMLGELIGYLKASNQWDDTIFVVTADHGEEFLDHGSWSHGGRLYQEQIHVPLLVKPPRGMHLEPRFIAEPVSLMDVAPTICELSGVSCQDASFQGRSLVPLLRGSSSWQQVPLFSELRKERRDLVCLRVGDLTLITHESPGEREELYDLASDPGQHRDLDGSYGEARLSMLRSLTEAHRSRMRPSGLFVEVLGDGMQSTVQVAVRSGKSRLDYTLLDGEAGQDRCSSQRIADGGFVVRADLTLGGEDRRDGIVLRSPPDEQVDLLVLVDGKPIAADHVLLGADGQEADAGLLHFRCTDPRLVVQEPPARDDRAGTWCRVWRVKAPEATIDSEAQGALEALGYTGH